MRVYFLIIFIAFTALSCKDEVQVKSDNITYLGGEIISPINDVVILSHYDKIIDTLKLNSKNRFLYKFEDLKPGLYSFSLQSSIGLEYQMVLLEPNDSVMFRLNTTDFDESLVYTGIGAKKNNYFINEFLQNETEEKTIYKYCLLDPVSFEHKIDSLKSLKIEKYQRFKNKYKTSDLFNKIALANINFSYYNSKEFYPIIQYKYNRSNVLKSIPDDFYAYRKDINYSDSFFKDYYNYNKFLKNSINNIAVKAHMDHANGQHFDRWHVCYNLDRLGLIDSIITDTKIKDDLLHYYTSEFLAKSKNLESNETILNYYLSKSSNDTGKKALSKYVSYLNNLAVGHKLPTVNIIDYNKKRLDINSIIDSPTVISFWSHDHYKHFKLSHRKIKELRKRN